jgi:hypothetical protein
METNELENDWKDVYAKMKRDFLTTVRVEVEAYICPVKIVQEQTERKIALLRDYARQLEMMLRDIIGQVKSEEASQGRGLADWRESEALLDRNRGKI